jgi:uncharacterized protein
VPQSGPFVIPAAALRKVSGTTRRVRASGRIDDLALLGVAVPAGADVAVDVTLSSYPGGVMAVGSVSAPWEGECRRCGEPVLGVVEVPVHERYLVRGPGAVPDRTGAPDRPDGPDEDAYPLEGDLLDLEPLARDAVLLELPLAPVCRPGCRGLCPQCGADLNSGPCACAEPVDPRWAALDALRDGEGGGLP